MGAPNPEVLKRLREFEVRLRAVELRLSETRALPKIGDGTVDVYGEYGIDQVLEFAELVAPLVVADADTSPELREMASMTIDTLQSLERMPR